MRATADHRVPLLVFAAAVLGVFVAAVTYTVDPLQASTWDRWDSGLYLQIADHGYRYYPCSAGAGGPGQFCGNAGWFPAYPYAMAALRLLTPLTTMQAGVLISWLFSLGIVLALWRTFLYRRTDQAAVIALAFAAFAPGQVYRFALFPLAMLVFFAILSLWWASGRRWVAAGLAGAVAGASYHLGALIVPILAVWAFSRPAATRAARVRNAAVCGGLAALGPLLVLLIMRVQTGVWNAFFVTQSKYEHHLRNPVTGFWDQVKHLFDGHVLGANDIPNLQVLLATVAVAILVVYGLRAWRQAPGGAEPLLVAWAVVMWAAPLCQTDVALYRNYALLTPAAPLLTRVPRTLGVVLVVVFAWLTAPLLGLFWNRILV